VRAPARFCGKKIIFVEFQSRKKKPSVLTETFEREVAKLKEVKKLEFSFVQFYFFGEYQIREDAKPPKVVSPPVLNAALVFCSSQRNSRHNKPSSRFLAPGVNLINLFFFVTDEQARLIPPGMPFKPSPIFAGKARSLL
jgi:hypothetical protein